MGYPMPSVLALLKSLCATNYIGFDPVTKEYSPTLRVAMLGSWIMGDLFRNGTVIALMDQIQKDTGETVILGAQSGLHAQYLHTVQSQRLLRFYLKPGLLRPMTKSAVGKALLMQYDNRQIERFVQEVNQSSTLERNFVNLQELLAEIGEAREQGYSFTEQLTKDICAIGMPLPLNMGIPCAIAVAGSTFRLKRKKEKVVAIMRQLSGICLR